MRPISSPRIPLPLALRGPLSGALLGACLALGGCRPHLACAPVTAADLSALPTRLSETGLYDDVAADALADGVRPYEPRFALWSDGAAKRRWLWLPPGEVIDTSDMDLWIFPEGTKLWKEFERDGVRVETRLLQKVGPSEGDWRAVAYLWDDDLGDARRVVDGVEDARGTAHDVPAATDCLGCHGGARSRALGVSAIQLPWEGEGEDLDLAELVAGGGLSDPPPEGGYTVPGDEIEAAALGYLHANCSHCHNQDRPDPGDARCYDPENSLDMRLLTTELSSTGVTRAYETVVATGLIQAGDPDHSYLLDLVSTRRERIQLSMPPLGTEEVDDAAVDLLRRWIEQM